VGGLGSPHKPNAQGGSARSSCPIYSPATSWQRPPSQPRESRHSNASVVDLRNTRRRASTSIAPRQCGRPRCHWQAPRNRHRSHSRMNEKLRRVFFHLYQNESTSDSKISPPLRNRTSLGVTLPAAAAARRARIEGFLCSRTSPSLRGHEEGVGIRRAALSGNLRGAPTNRQIGQAALSVARFGCFRFDGVFLKTTLRSSALFASRNGANLHLRIRQNIEICEFGRRGGGAERAITLADVGARRSSSAQIRKVRTRQSTATQHFRRDMSARRPACLPKQPPALCTFSFFVARTGTCRRTCRAFPSPADATDRDRGGNDHRQGDRGSIASFAAQIRIR
jgi:hypothetical protein